MGFSKNNSSIVSNIKNNAQIFTNVKWGKSGVFAHTCENISALGLKLGLLPERWDVDRTVDLLPYFKMKRKNVLIKD